MNAAQPSSPALEPSRLGDFSATPHTVSSSMLAIGIGVITT